MVLKEVLNWIFKPLTKILKGKAQLHIIEDLGKTVKKESSFTALSKLNTEPPKLIGIDEFSAALKKRGIDMPVIPRTNLVIPQKTGLKI